MFDKNMFKFSERIVNSIVTREKKWICFGVGKELIPFIQEFCIQKKILPLPDYICDNDKKLQGERIVSILVVSPDRILKEELDKCVIVVSSGLPYSIIYELVTVRNQYYSLFVPMSQIKTHFYVKDNIERLNEIYDLLEDEKSKENYEQYFKTILDGNCLFSSVYTPNAYWNNDLIEELKDGEVVVYAGAYDGKHIERAIKSNANAIVHGFEPNENFTEKLRQKYSENKNIMIHNCALYDEQTELYFDNSKELSANIVSGEQIGEDKNTGNYTVVKTMRLDDELNIKVDLIALDVEGSELKALDGSKRIISIYRPKLGICVYHKLDHYVEIPLKIKELNPNYKLYFRHHSVTLNESVIYAMEG